MNLFLSRNRRVGGWARRIWRFPLVKPYRKSTPGGRWCSPPQAKPAHNNTVCTDSKGNKASKTSTAEAFPLPPFCYALPVLLFLASCIDRTRRENNRIHNNEKAKTSTRREKQKERKQESIKRNKQKQKKADRAIILKYQANKTPLKSKRKARQAKQFTSIWL